MKLETLQVRNLSISYPQFLLYTNVSLALFSLKWEIFQDINTYRNNKIIHSINPPFIKLVLLCLNLSDGEV